MPGKYYPRYKIAYPHPRLVLDQTENLTIFGETAQLLFGKDLLSVDNNFKNTAAAGNQFDIYVRTKGTM